MFYYANKLVRSHVSLCGVLQRQENHNSAVEEIQAAIIVLQSLGNVYPADGMADVIADTHHLLGTVLCWSSKYPTAFDQWHLALDIRQTLSAKDPTSTIMLAKLFESHMALGWAKLTQADIEGSIVEYKGAQAIVNLLVKHDNTRRDWQEMYEDAERTIGILSELSVTGNLPGPYYGDNEVIDLLLSLDQQQQAGSVSAKS